MPEPEAIFQFFYSSTADGLPHPDVPVRDVTNAQGAGHKTEPNLERRMENWCSCRARFVTSATVRARALAKSGGQHYLILTTRSPKTGSALAVGLMPFSLKAFQSVLKNANGRWKEHLPYVSDRGMKICSFADGFPLVESTSKDGTKHVPGSRYAVVRVVADFLRRLILHFAAKPDRTREFLANVDALEGHLKQQDPVAYQDYRSRSPEAGRCR